MRRTIAKSAAAVNAPRVCYAFGVRVFALIAIAGLLGCSGSSAGSSSSSGTSGSGSSTSGGSGSTSGSSGSTSGSSGTTGFVFTGTLDGGPPLTANALEGALAFPLVSTSPGCGAFSDGGCLGNYVIVGLDGPASACDATVYVQEVSITVGAELHATLSPGTYALGHSDGGIFAGVAWDLAFVDGGSVYLSAPVGYVTLEDFAPAGAPSARGSFDVLIELPDGGPSELRGAFDSAIPKACP